MAETIQSAEVQNSDLQSIGKDRMEVLYNEIEDKRNQISELRSAVSTPGFKASAEDIIALRAHAQTEIPKLEADIEAMSNEVKDVTLARQENIDSLMNEISSGTSNGEEYTLSNDMDKELAYLEQEFGNVANPEDVAAALDLVSDFCDAHNLDRAAEKQLRARFLKTSEKHTEEAPTVSEPPVDAGITDTPNVQEPQVTSEEQTGDGEIASEYALGTRVKLVNEYGEDRTGTIIDVKLDESHPSGVVYIIKPEEIYLNESVIAAHKEDLSVLDDVVIPEIVPTAAVASDSKQEIEDAVIVEDNSTPVESTEAAAEEDVDGSNTEQEEVNSNGSENPVVEKSQWEKLKDAPTAVAIAITAKLTETRKKWNELTPDKKKKYKIIGVLAAVAAGAVVVALMAKGHDTSGLTDSTSPDATPSGGSSPSGPDVIQSPDGGSPSLTNAQKDFAGSYANTPWQAAVDSYGPEKAADALKSAVEKAQAAGENIRTSGAGTSWKIQANGSWNPQVVNNVLAPYMPKQ